MLKRLRFQRFRSKQAKTSDRQRDKLLISTQMTQLTLHDKTNFLKTCRLHDGKQCIRQWIPSHESFAARSEETVISLRFV